MGEMVTANGAFVAKQVGQLQLNELGHYAQKCRFSGELFFRSLYDYVFGPLR